MEKSTTEQIFELIDLLNEQQELIGDVVNQITSITKLLEVMASRIEGIENS